ncbi:MAG: UTRA domain-containing protein, partial [Micromonosporaceae bacterium]
GVDVTRVDEQITCRHPTPEESGRLHLSADDLVMAVARRMFAGDRPVEIADIVLPAEQVEIDYQVDIPQPE